MAFKFKAYAAGGVFYAGGGAIPMPVPPTLMSSVQSDTSVVLTWYGGQYIQASRVMVKPYGGSYSQWPNITTTYTSGRVAVTGLTAGTRYLFKIASFNDTGSVESNEVEARTYSDSSIPESTPYTELLDSVRNAIIQLDDFEEENVVVGVFEDLENREDSGQFPCVEIVNGEDRGNSYSSQREIEGVINIRLCVHYYAGTPSRQDGTDMKLIARYGAAVVRQMYRFNEYPSDQLPCTGFLQTEADYKKLTVYEAFSPNCNSDIIEIGFRVANQDVSI